MALHEHCKRRLKHLSNTLRTFTLTPCSSMPRSSPRGSSTSPSMVKTQQPYARSRPSTAASSADRKEIVETIELERPPELQAIEDMTRQERDALWRQLMAEQRAEQEAAALAGDSVEAPLYKLED